MTHDKGCCSDCGYLTTNAVVSGELRRFEDDGVDILAVPVVAIVEGVLNGYLVPNEEIEKFVTAWEGVPVPVHHPQINGQHVSANIPQVLAARRVGRFHNVRAEGGKLKGEIWIDVNRANDKGFADVIQAFEAGELMEVSTAYFADTDPQQGIFNGKRYAGIHRNLRPDHLALLPGDTGACSIADGCGAMRTNHSEATMSEQKDKPGFFDRLKSFFGNDQSMTEKVSAVRAAVDEMDGHGQVHYLVEVFEDSAIYENGGTMYKRNYSIGEDGKATFTSDPEPVRMEKEFVPLGDSSDDEPEANAEGAPDETQQPNQPGEQPKTNEDDAMSDENTQAAQLDAESLTALNWAKKNYADTKNHLVSKLTANKACAFSEDRLQAMHVDDLKSLDQSLSPRDYSGRGMPLETNSQHEDDAPVLDLGEPVVLKAIDGGAK